MLNFLIVQSDRVYDANPIVRMLMLQYYQILWLRHNASMNE